MQKSNKQKSGSSNRIFYILGAIVLILILMAVIGKKMGWVGESEAVRVAVEEVKKRTIIEKVTANGKIHPETEVKISSDVSGEVVKLEVAEGDSVLEGQLLLAVKPDIYESMVARADAALNQMKANHASALASLSQVQAQFEQAQSAYNRNKKLHEQKVISDADFETSLASYRTAEANLESAKQSVKAASYNIKSAEASLKEARDNLDKTRIYAPIGGIVSKMNIELGERVVGTAQMAGTEILRIANLNHMEARVEVSENDVLRVSMGDSAEVEVDAYLNKKFLGIVTQIANSPKSDLQISTEQVTNFEVQIRLLRASYKELIQPEKGHRYPFRPGMSATVDIQTERVKNVICVPIQAVTARALDAEESEKEEEATETKKKEKISEIVFVADQNESIVNILEVETGIQDESYIQVKSGLVEGQEVVIAPFKAIAKTLKAGTEVSVVKEDLLFKKD